MDHEWQIGDDPMSHPLWELNWSLEEGMLRAGAKAYADSVKTAQDNNAMTRVGPVRGLMSQWLPLVAKGVMDYKRDMKSKRRGPEPMALKYLQMCDPYVAAAVATKTVLDCLGSASRGANSILAMALGIGLNIEHECRVRKWEEQDPDLFYAVEEKLKRDKATHQHRRLVHINRFNHLMGTGELSFDWQSWGKEAHFRTGAALLDIVIRATGWFELVPDPEHVFKKGPVRAPSLTLQAKPELLTWLRGELEDSELRHPTYQPTVIPPKRWNGTREGGYWSPYVVPPRLIRFKAHQEQQQARAADEYDALDMPKVYEALHVLQETPWAVNHKVLAVVRQSWEKDLGLGSLPLQGDEGMRKIRPRPDTEDTQLIIDWKREASEAHAYNNRRYSAIDSADRTIKTACRYAGMNFYFPHKLDFRGRIYPVPVYLQPQGSDLARGLLTFAQGVPITQENGGAQWLAIQVTTFWERGIDKLPFEERLAWVSENSPLLEAIAADPFGNDQWSTGEKPWQLLAAIFEWAGWIAEGPGFVSTLPVMVDGTCNGLQHLSAMTRDAIAGAHVNLTPSDRPQDIYKFVGRELQATLERIEGAGGAEGEKARKWLDILGRDIPRDFTKRQVMVLPYGGTRESFYEYTKAWLDKNHPEPVIPGETKEQRKERRSERNKATGWVVGHLWDTVKQHVRGGMQVMEWLQDCAKAVAKADQPIFWRVPSGFVVRHFYGITKSRQVFVKLTGEAHVLRMDEHTAKLDTKSQVQGIAPNFIHSLDASALVDCVIESRKAGIKSFTSIHDAYGTHAGNMWALYAILRDAFVETHLADPLGNFRSACQSVLVALYVAQGMDVLEASERADSELPAPLELGDLDLEGIRESDYFFA